MDNAYYEDLAGRLYGLVIRLSDRMPADGAGWVHHVTEVGEYEPSARGPGRDPRPRQDRHHRRGVGAEMLALGRKMTLQHDLAGVLGACPRAAGDHGPGSR